MVFWLACCFVLGRPFSAHVVTGWKEASISIGNSSIIENGSRQLQSQQLWAILSYHKPLSLGLRNTSCRCIPVGGVFIILSLFRQQCNCDGEGLDSTDVVVASNPPPGSPCSLAGLGVWPRGDGEGEDDGIRATLHSTQNLGKLTIPRLSAIGMVEKELTAMLQFASIAGA